MQFLPRSSRAAWVVGSAAILLGVAVIMLSWQGIVRRAAFNLAAVYVNQALLPDDQPAVLRQTKLKRAAQWLALGTGSQLSASAEDQTVPNRFGPASMVAEIYLGEHYRQNRQTDLAALHYWRAAFATPVPALQPAVMVPIDVPLTADNVFVLNGSSPNWRVRRDSPAAATITPLADGSATFAFESKPGVRNRGSFQWFRAFAIPFHHTFVIRAILPPTCRVIAEHVIDDHFERTLTQAGTGEWQELTFTGQGEWLQYLYFHLDGIEEETMQCAMQLDSVMILPDSPARLPASP